MPNIFEAAAFGMECQRVIWLRMMKLAAGGPKAQIEANLMVAEKMLAAADAGMKLAFGKSSDEVFQRYRKTVRVNGRRLGKRPR